MNHRKNPTLSSRSGTMGLSVLLECQAPHSRLKLLVKLGSDPWPRVSLGHREAKKKKKPGHIRTLGPEVWLCLLLAVCLCPSHLTSLGLFCNV